MAHRAGAHRLRHALKFYAGALESLTAYAKGACYQSFFGADLQSAKRQIAKLPPAARAKAEANLAQNEPPELSDPLKLVWAWFSELSALRREGFNGPSPLCYADISAWSSLTQQFPSPSEMRLIIAADRAWLAEWHRCYELKHPKRD